MSAPKKDFAALIDRMLKDDAFSKKVHLDPESNRWLTNEYNLTDQNISVLKKLDKRRMESMKKFVKNSDKVVSQGLVEQLSKSETADIYNGGGNGPSG